MNHSATFLIGLIVSFLSIVTALGCNKKKTEEGYKITGIRVSNSSLQLKVGDSQQLKASTIPAVANQPYFEWSSDNEAIVTVVDGMIKAIAVGQAIITVGAQGVSTTISVKVDPAPIINHAYSDTVIKMTLSGAAYSFAGKADYGVYIPSRSESLQGVLIIQHGCGMEQFGITKPYDLQYRAFARKWNVAIVETALHGNCGGWRDPDSGSGTALLKVLSDAGDQSGHPELSKVPWLLWGHSGGGYWTLGMLRSYPDRIMAAVCYSPAFDPQWTYPSTVAKIPLLTRHAGVNDANADGVLCQATSINLFRKLREVNAPASIALNETQNHNYSYIRYMAIPFYEAVLKQRLVKDGNGAMNELNPEETWLGDTLTHELYKASTYAGDKKSLCLLPDENTAKIWKEYVTTGTVKDKTPPTAPFNLSVRKVSDDIEINWAADADIESGILRFEIFKDDILIGWLPSTGAYQGFDTNGDNTVPAEVAPMQFQIAGAGNVNTTISIRTVNHFNLVSEKATITYTK